MSKNSIENVFNDDLIMRNYMALLACILNPKLKYNDSLKFFEISDRSNLEIDFKNNTIKKVKKNRYKNYRKIKMLDTLTNEERIFESVCEVESQTGIKKENIYVYISKNVLGKRRYKFSYCDKEN